MGRYPREQGLDPDAIAMAVQHHEKLDGTGYPPVASQRPHGNGVYLVKTTVVSTLPLAATVTSTLFTPSTGCQALRV